MYLYFAIDFCLMLILMVRAWYSIFFIHTVPLIVLKTTITDEPDNVIPGVQYVLTCTVTKLLDGLINTPTVEWLDSGMNNIHGVNGISTTISNSGVSQLTFFQLKTSHAGSYVCQGNLSSPASPTELTQSVAHDISLQGKPWNIHVDI